MARSVIHSGGTEIMYRNLFFAKSFWTSKLGQAAFASIAAMSAMVVLTSQFGAANPDAAQFAQPHGDTVVVAEIA
ncbi:hypothetical protein FGU71_09405 [Erythrobacter insulae]|uniref:Uncharacterized protein n=1 Tax=Erythrobacter insulae TaxID=2584124 RepID=A0A547PD32_9SPHN|nr:hypothetical protein [Erythrobacter insulae]TRD12052.1 hypothetical protein FGU71_09405 [Erythrobacter insulae]